MNSAYERKPEHITRDNADFDKSRVYCVAFNLRAMRFLIVI